MPIIAKEDSMEPSVTYSHTPSVWLLLDERPSHRAQVMGVAERLGIPFEIKEIRYNRWAMFANALLGARLTHLTDASRASICAPWPDLVIAAGRRTAPVMLYLRKHAPGVKLVHLMWPDAGADAFDLIALPKHDMGNRKTGANVLQTAGALHSITPAKLMMEAARFHMPVSRLPRPRIALLVGGNTRHNDYEDADFKTLAAYASAEAERLGGSLMVSSSRRTGEHGESIIKSLLTCPHIFHRWHNEGDNPYVGFLGLADAIIVTGDSVSMCSEACATGKPVYIFVPPHLTGGKNSFRDSLFAMGCAKPHTYPIRLDWQPTPLPDATGEVAKVISVNLFHVEHFS